MVNFRFYFLKGTFFCIIIDEILVICFGILLIVIVLLLVSGIIFKNKYFITKDF